VVLASEKEAESWSAADKFMMMLENATRKTAELGGYYRVGGSIPSN